MLSVPVPLAPTTWPDFEHLYILFLIFPCSNLFCWPASAPKLLDAVHKSTDYLYVFLFVAAIYFLSINFLLFFFQQWESIWELKKEALQIDARAITEKSKARELQYVFWLLDLP